MSELLWILSATILISLISFIGAGTLVIKKKLLEKILLALVGLAAGALIGGAFLHLLPEAIEQGSWSLNNIFLALIVGLMVFFILEKALWRHCHKRDCPIHVFAYLNLFGDGVHNFIDGLIIAASFVVSIPLGLVVTLAVAVHEIPQELGDFGVLVYGGFNPKKALLLNFITALTAVAGGVLGFYLLHYFGNVIVFLLPFAAGGFLYIASSDLIPELHKGTGAMETLVSTSTFIMGIILMWVIRVIFGG